MLSEVMNKRSDNHLYLVDGSGFIFRAYHALPPLTRPDGKPIGAVLGFTNMLIRLIIDMHADHLAVIFDSSRQSFRNDIYPDYKAHRPPPPEDLIPQFPLVREACRAFNVAQVEMQGFEADDLIATYAEQAKAKGMDVTIVSSDKDLMQLVGGAVKMYDPIKNRDIGVEEVIEKFGLPPEKVTDIQALAGDSTDNVPGVPGIGIKTAAQLIHEFGDLETLLTRAHEIPQQKRREKLLENVENARISKELVTLKRDIKTEKSIEDFSFQEPIMEDLTRFLDENSFSKIKSRMEQQGFKLGTKEVKATAEKGTYSLVQDIDTLRKWIEKIYEAGRVAIDTETTSLNPLEAELVGVSLSVKSGEACYIPVGHQSGAKDLFGQQVGPDVRQIPRQQVLDLLKPVLNDRSILKIGQNLKYDMLVLGRYGLEMSPIDDTMVMSYVVDGTSHGHGMDELAELHLGYHTIKYKDVVGTGKAQLRFDQVEIHKACDYAAEDADITGRLYDILGPMLVQRSCESVYQTMDRPMIHVLAEMEREGIGVNLERLKELSHHFASRIQALEQEIYQATGREFNIASPKQLGEVLFEHLSLPGGQKSSKTGAYATGADILEDLAVQGHHIPILILDWRHLAKLKSTYSDALQKQINPHTGRVHTSFGMTVTSTGRLSSNDPNLQNIPIKSKDGMKIRQAFEAKPGWKFVSLDYSQVELRLLAHMADLPSLQESFQHGEDIHAKAASEVFGVPLDEVTPGLRSHAKVINFGIIYGISAQGLSRQLRIPRADAAKHIKTYLKRYPGIKTYMEERKREAQEQGYVKTLFGRHCYIQGINEKNFARRGFAERAAINAPLQGTVADIIKRAMIKSGPALQDQGLKAKLLLQIHDELIFEVPDDEVEHTISIIKPIMENQVQLKVPLIVDTGVGQTWADT